MNYFDTNIIRLPTLTESIVKWFQNEIWNSSIYLGKWKLQSADLLSLIDINLSMTRPSPKPDWPVETSDKDKIILNIIKLGNSGMYFLYRMVSHPSFVAIWSTYRLIRKENQFVS